MPVRTTEQTSKSLKMRWLICNIMCLVGVIWLIVLASEPKPAPPESYTIPAVLLVVGMIWGMLTKFRIWWHHK